MDDNDEGLVSLLSDFRAVIAARLKEALKKSDDGLREDLGEIIQELEAS